MATRTETLVAKFTGDASGLVNASKQGANALAKLEKQSTRSTKVILGGFSGMNLGFNAMVQNITLAGRLIGKAFDQIKQVDALAKTAKAAGLSAESYQELAHAANLAGIEAGSFDSAMVKLNVNLGKAQAGSKKQVDAFNKLGVTSTDADTALRQIADGLASISDPAERARLAAEIFGKEAGPRLVEMLGQGNAALEEMRSTTSKLSDEQVRAAEELADRWDILANRLDTGLKAVVIETTDALRMMLAAGGTIDATGLQEMQARVDQLRDDATRARAALDGGFAKGNPEYRAKLEVFAGRKEADLATAEADLEKEMRRRGILRGPQVAPDGSTPTRANINENGGVGRVAYGPRAADHFKVVGDKDTEAKEAAKQTKGYADLMNELQDAEERRARGRAELEQAAIERNREEFESLQRIGEARMAEAEAMATQQEKIREFSQGVSANLADMAIKGGSAADDLKRKVVQALLQASIQAFSSMGGGGGGVSWGKLGLGILGTVVGANFGGGGSVGNFDAASGGTFTPQGPTQFASGGSFKVGGSGGTDSKRISFDATPGELVDIRRPGGTMGGGGGAKVEQNVSVNVSNNHSGADIKTETRRGPNGEQQIQVIVDRAIAKSAATRRGGANAILDDSGSRRAPRPGIS